MSGVLVVAEHLQGTLREVTLELITAARELGQSVTVAVIAHDPEALVESVSVEGVDEIVTVALEPVEFEPDPYALALETIVSERQPTAVLLGFTVNSMGFAPAVAARLGLGFASDVFGFATNAADDDGIVALRSFYGSRVHAEVSFPSGPVMLLLRPTTWAPGGGRSNPRVSEVSMPACVSRSHHVAFEEVEAADAVDITTADFLLSVGRGVGERENIETFENLAKKMGATLAVSRPLVDAGWVAPTRQVGQSGKTVKPKVYLALGISGAVQHLAGMKGSGTIIAVNTDPDAAIFSVAHYGALVDLFDLADELDKLY